MYVLVFLFFVVLFLIGIVGMLKVGAVVVVEIRVDVGARNFFVGIGDGDGVLGGAFPGGKSATAMMSSYSLL
jgi:hypothetical protein